MISMKFKKMAILTTLILTFVNCSNIKSKPVEIKREIASMEELQEALRAVLRDPNMSEAAKTRLRASMKSLESSSPASTPLPPLPITKVDKIVLPIMFNINSYISAKVGVLTDAASYIESHEALLNQYANDGQLLSLLVNADEKWVIALGAGHGAKAFFDMLKVSYDDVGPGQKIIFRTTKASSNWVTSSFEGEWSHKIESKRVDFDIEYYGVPGSYLYVARIIPAGSNAEDPSNYFVITRSPEIWRQAFSPQSGPLSNTVENSFAIAKNYSNDIVDVVRGTRNSAFKLKLNWTSHSHLISVTAKKLYQ